MNNQTKQANLSNHFDIIIIGGGIVGLTMAAALGKSNLRVAIIDSKYPQFNIDKQHYDVRVSAITQASQTIWQMLDVWPLIKAKRLAAYRKMHVWNECGKISFDCLDVAQPCLGYIIENNIICQALVELLQSLENISIMAPATPHHFIVNQNNVYLFLNNQIELSCNLLIGADGANSWLRHQCNIQLNKKDYGQTAIIANVRTANSHEFTAWQRFLLTGPLAFLPFAQADTCSIVWSSDHYKAKILMAMDELAFNQALTDAFNYRLGKVELISKRVDYPLTMRHAKNYVMPRIALLGDAIHTLHPLAGQGVNLGLLDVASLAEVILKAAAQQQDVGLLPLLKRYERWRKGHNLLMLTAMQGFKQLFAAESSVINWLRNNGLNITDKMLPVKNLLVRYAMGTVGDLPLLAKGIPV